ncbi:MAG TPA: hypothetical protein VGN88_03015 [Phycisphaerae bacterium]|jgi:hypothetical protein
MLVIARSLLVCLTLVGMLLVHTVCVCPATEHHEDATTKAVPSDPCDNDNDGDHDQDHHDHGVCTCAPSFYFAADQTSSVLVKPTTPSPFFSSFDGASLDDVSSLPAIKKAHMNAVAIHPPTAVTTLLRLHCALIV